MNARRARVIGTWLTCVALAAIVVARARYVTDLSAFLPEKPTPMQRLLVDQLREGPTSRVILIALERGDATIRARISVAMARRLRLDRKFSRIENGEPVTAERDREFLFRHRYLLSETVTAQRFSAAGLKSAIAETIAGLASPEGLLLKSLVPRDPTGEMLQIIDQMSRIARPQTQDGVWVSADGERTLLVAQAAAPGSDTDAQELALDAIRRAFTAAYRETAAAVPESRQVQMNLTGPPVFAVAARATIQHAAGGRAPLGASSVGGLLAAAAVTRFVLPEMMPGDLAVRDIPPWGLRLEQLLRP